MNHETALGADPRQAALYVRLVPKEERQSRAFVEPQREPLGPCSSLDAWNLLDELPANEQLDERGDIGLVARAGALQPLAEHGPKARPRGKRRGRRRCKERSRGISKVAGEQPTCLAVAVSLACSIREFGLFEPKKFALGKLPLHGGATFGLNVVDVELGRGNCLHVG